ncbi:hypothetical protein RYX36_019902 [Vicia faba]
MKGVPTVTQKLHAPENVRLQMVVEHRRCGELFCVTSVFSNGSQLDAEVAWPFCGRGAQWLCCCGVVIRRCYRSRCGWVVRLLSAEGRKSPTGFVHGGSCAYVVADP